MRLIVASIFLLVCFSVSQADQLAPFILADQTIVTGSLTGRSRPGPGLNFAFGAPGFFAQGSAAGSNSGIIPLASLIPFYSAGSSINLGLGTNGLAGSERLSGSMIYNGITYSLVATTNVPGTSAGFSFQSSGVVPLSTESTIIITAPFTMRGILNAADPSGIQLTLTGQGIASLTLIRNANGTYSFDGNQGVRYDFAEPTPEPVTFLLLATGLTSFGGFIRKRRLKKRSDCRE